MAKPSETSVTFKLRKEVLSDVAGNIKVERRVGELNGGYGTYDLLATFVGVKREYQLPGMSLAPILHGTQNHTDQIREHDRNLGQNILWPAAILAMELVDNYDPRGNFLGVYRLQYLDNWVHTHMLKPQDREDLFLFQNMKAIVARAAIQLVVDGKPVTLHRG